MLFLFLFLFLGVKKHRAKKESKSIPLPFLLQAAIQTTLYIHVYVLEIIHIYRCNYCSCFLKHAKLYTFANKQPTCKTIQLCMIDGSRVDVIACFRFFLSMFSAISAQTKFRSAG